MRRLLLLLILASIILARFVTEQEALSVASFHLDVNREFARNELGIPHWFEGKSHSIAGISGLRDSNTNELFVYIITLEPRGYIAVSTMTEITPIIAYSFKCDFVFEDSPQNIMLHLLRWDLTKRIAGIPYTDRKIIEENISLWEGYLNRDKELGIALSMTTTYGPWLDTKWDQGPPYNNFCPVDPATSTRCVTGCVATAMGMIVDYWEWPRSVRFTSADNYTSRGTTPSIYIYATTANMDTIDYNGAGRYPTTETIARLLFACGVSVKMQYGVDGSSSNTTEVPSALLNKFNYSTAIGVMVMNPNFYPVLQENARTAKPVELGIWGPEGGHAINVDGWRTSGVYHLNMGWSGYYDGWYSLPSGMPAGFTAVGHQATNIMPPVITRRPPSTISAHALAGGAVRVVWGAPLYITEPVIRYNIYRKTIMDPYSLIGNTSSREFLDHTVEELTYYEYGISAVYSAGESGMREVSVYSGIHGGWSRTFGDIGDQSALCVVPGPQNGCVVAGYSQFEGMDMDAFFVRTTAGSTPLWQKIYGKRNRDIARSIVDSDDTTFVAVGTSESYSSDADIWLVKLDKNGDTLWTRIIARSGRQEGYAIARTPDNGFIVVGTSGDSTTAKLLAIKTNSSGVPVWQREFGEGLHPRAVAKVPSGGFVVAGFVCAGPIGREDYLIMKLSDSGDSVWAKNYGGAYTESANSITPTSDGGFIVAGNSYSLGYPSLSAIYLLKLDSNGNALWSRIYKGFGDNMANSVFETQNGDFLIGGSVKRMGEINFYLLRTEGDGDSIWAKNIGTLGTDICYRAIELSDSGIVAVGKTFMNGTEDFWVMKLGGDLYSKTDEPASLPNKTNISRAVPNPFNSSVSIALSVDISPSSHTAQIDIFDISGRIVDHIPSCKNKDGLFEALWTPSNNITSGIYFARISGGNENPLRIIYLK